MRPFTDNDLRPLVLAAVTIVCTRRRVDAARRRAVTSAPACSPRVTSSRPDRSGSAHRSVWRSASSSPCSSRGARVRRRPRSRSASSPRWRPVRFPTRSATRSTSSACRARFLRQYFGVAFLLVATVVALLPASQIGATAEEETSGRLVQLLAQPVRRVSLLSGRLALGAAGIVRRGRAGRTHGVGRRGDARCRSRVGAHGRRRAQRRPDRVARARYRCSRARGRAPCRRPLPSTAS